MNKILSFVCCALLLIFIPCAFSEETSIKEDTKNLFSDIGSAAKKLGGKIGQSVSGTVGDVKGMLNKSCTGKWLFTNGKAETTLVIGDDNTMEIIQKKGLRTRSWKGTFEQSGDTITFTPKSIKATDWNLHYKLQNSSTQMQVTSSEMMRDFNDFDFSNPAIFIKETE